ncbi:flagellar basal-body rod protein FlgB [gamma proteobacterium HIMB55]|nr:flagellar basal-body rod protein FlgB [gamma proteobacterium HIMB55]
MTAIDKALGISPQVLALRAQRMNLLSSNIANAQTAGYKARDIDFAAALEQATASQGEMRQTHSAHIPLGGSMGQPDALYRVPSEVAPDGNSVDPTLEHATFMDNALRYQASLQLLDSRIKGIRNAIKGDS